MCTLKTQKREGTKTRSMCGGACVKPLYEVDGRLDGSGRVIIAHIRANMINERKIGAANHGAAMPHFKIAHLRQQGQDMIIVPLESSFENKTGHDQQQIISDLQIHARAAGLVGTVVPVWDGGGGRMKFIAPQPWHPFFKSLNLRSVFSNINKDLSW